MSDALNSEDSERAALVGNNEHFTGMEVGDVVVFVVHAACVIEGKW